MASFEEIMNKPASEIKAPQAYPPGTYHCLVDGPPTVGESARQNKFWTFKFKILEAQKDVDAHAAAEQQVVGKIINADYYVTDAAAYRMIEMLTDHLGIDKGPAPGKSPTELLAEAPGKQLLVNLVHDVSQDGKRTYHKVKSTAHV